MNKSEQTQLTHTEQSDTVPVYGRSLSEHLKTMGKFAFFGAVAVGALIVADNISTNPNGFNHAECVAELMDETPTLPEAEEITAEFCSTGVAEMDDRVAFEGVMLRLEMLANN